MRAQSCYIRFQVTQPTIRHVPLAWSKCDPDCTDQPVDTFREEVDTNRVSFGSSELHVFAL